jgi:uncharacterized protein YutE (UPF0331/DUF86 family)
MSVNRLFVRQRLVLIGLSVDHLRRLSTIPIERFVNSDLSAAAESYLRRTLEAIFDVGRHILSKSGANELAQEYKSIARGLAEMAGYRNRLVQLYDLVSDEEIYAILHHHLTDFHDFITQIEKYLKSAVT